MLQGRINWANQNILAWSCFWDSSFLWTGWLIEHKCPSHKLLSSSMCWKGETAATTNINVLNSESILKSFISRCHFFGVGLHQPVRGMWSVDLTDIARSSFFGAKTSSSNLIVSRASIKICALTFWHLGTFSHHQWWQTDSLHSFLLPFTREADSKFAIVHAWKNSC